MTVSRHRFLGLSAAVPFAVLAAASARGAETAACYDPATLPFSQKSRRRSLGYLEAATDPNKRCGQCAFFTAAATASCGTCQLLAGAQVQAGAVCNSFAARAKP